MARDLTDTELLAIRPVISDGIDLTLYFLTPDQRLRRRRLLEKESKENSQTAAIAHAAAAAAAAEVKGAAIELKDAAGTIAKTAADIASSPEDSGQTFSPASTPRRIGSFVWHIVRAVIVFLAIGLLVSVVIYALQYDVGLLTALTAVLASVKDFVQGIIDAVTRAFSS